MTGIAAHAAARRNRWAVSFADLLLLLLGFFVLLQASGGKRDAMLANVAQQFGGRTVRQAQELRADKLFVLGEALLTPAGRRRIGQVARGLRDQHIDTELDSFGFERSSGRFDQWDLAAARLGAVARALKEDGVPEERLKIRGLDQADDRGGGQVIRIAPAA